MEVLTKIIVISVLLENLIELVIKPMLKKHQDEINYDYISAILGIILSIMFGLNIFTDLNIFSENYVPTIIEFFFSNVVTGLIIARGSNIVSKFLSIVDAKKDVIKND